MCDCEIKYSDFRTGFNFNDIRQLLYRESKKKREKFNEHMFITRKTVLGRWHEIKIGMWKEFQDQLELGCECKSNIQKKEKIYVDSEDVI